VIAAQRVIQDAPIRADVVIVGAGIVGATAAYFLAKAGVETIIIERAHVAAEASGSNAGMVGPAAEDEGLTYHLALQSAELYKMASEQSSKPMGYVQGGRLALAIEPDEVRRCEQFVKDRVRRGIESSILYGREIIDVEPALSHEIVAGAYTPSDGKIDPVLATTAFLEAAQDLGAVYLPGTPVKTLEMRDRRVAGVRLETHVILADHVLLAAGAWSPYLAETINLSLPVQPGKGHMLATVPAHFHTPLVLRFSLLGMRQTEAGNLLVGSEVEPGRFDKRVESETINRFRQFSERFVPGLTQVPTQRTWAGIRPMTPDNLPILGEVPGLPGLLLATGHGRTGMTLGPASALAVSQLIVQGQSEIPVNSLSIRRFMA
jgi:glycine oxidase